MISVFACNHTKPQPSCRNSAPRSGVDAHITHIVADVRAQRRSKVDSRSDLIVILQPRNADGQYVALPSEVSVVVLDSAEAGEAQRVARWDFSAAETARMIHPDAAERGIHLEFDWPEDVSNSELLRSKGLHIFVRYVTVDGRKLQTDQPLEVRNSYDLGIRRTLAAEWVADDSDSSTGWKVVTASSDAHDLGAAAIALPSPSEWSVVPSAGGEPEEPKPLQLPAGQLGSLIELPRPLDTDSQPEQVESDGESPLESAAALPVLRPQETATRPSWSPHR